MKENSIYLSQQLEEYYNFKILYFKLILENKKKRIQI